MLATLLTLATLSGAAAGSLHGAAEPDAFGSAVAGAGDVDGDGCPDVLVGDPADRSGRALLLSGRTGAELLVLDGGPGFGHAVAGLGDVDGDGVPDVAVGTRTERGDPAGPRVEVRSGRTGRVLLRLGGAYLDPSNAFDTELGRASGRRRGAHVAAAGDVDGDGRADLVAGATVRSGRDGSVLLRLRGSGIVAVGDVDRDGSPDFAGYEVTDEEGPDGAVLVQSGRDGRVLLELGARFDGHAVASVAGVGRVDRDEHPDLVVGYRGRSRLVSGRDGGALPCWTHGGGGGWAAVVVGLGDVDGDGAGDALITSDSPWAPLGPATVEIRSGRTEARLLRVDALDDQRVLLAAAAVGDVDGDGACDFVLGEVRAPCCPGPGHVRLISSADGSALRTWSRAVPAGR